MVANPVTTVYLNDGLLECSRIVVHIVTAETQEAHKDEHAEPVEPSPGVQGKEVLQKVLLLGSRGLSSDDRSQVLMTASNTGSIY